MNNPDPHPDLSRGITFVILMHVIVLPLLGLVIYVLTMDDPGYLIPHWMSPFFMIGIIQWANELPVNLFYERRKRPELVKGMVIGACATFLLNGGCFVLLGLSLV